MIIETEDARAGKIGVGVLHVLAVSIGLVVVAMTAACLGVI
jgi:hypothetical protein